MLPYELIAAAVLLNGTLALAAVWRRAVSPTGAVAGFLTGAGILLFSGWTSWFCLGAFFVTSTIASRIGRDRKSTIELIQEKGSRRDALQVIANGGVGLIAAAGFAALGNRHIWLIALAAAFAEANADTWATELGVLSRRPPVSILNGRPILPGMSGGVTGAGFLAAAGGAFLVAVVFAAGSALFGAARVTAQLAADAAIVAAAGWIGSVVDSLLGATLQPLYIRPGTGDLTERRHNAAGPNARVRGIPFFTNDVVNFLSTLAAALLAAACAGALTQVFPAR